MDFSLEIWYNILGECMSDEKGKKPIKRTKKYESSNMTSDAKKPIKKVKDKNKIVINKKKVMPVILFIVIAVLLLFFIKIVSKPRLEKIKDSVVMIEVYDDNDELLSTGSGFCAYDNNYIVTNFHVIEGASSIVIITDDNETYEATDVLIFDAENDLAILDTTADLKPLKFGNAKHLKSGDKVTAIGSPLGEMNTVSTGIISNAKNDKGIQITASISHGSSGGALFNKNNKLIGITYATLESGQNLNYAISVEYLDDLYKAYKKGTYSDIEYDYYESCMHSTDSVSFTGCVPYTSDYYVPENMDIFNKVTNLQKRYDYSMENGGMSDLYYDLSYSDKKLAYEYYYELENTYFCEDDCDINADISDWNVSEFMINLGVLNKQELAFVMVDIDNYNNDSAIFKRLESYPMMAAEKALIAHLIGDVSWNNIHKDNKEDIFDYFEHLYTPDFGAILEILGYEVRYNNDGTLTAWW